MKTSIPILAGLLVLLLIAAAALSLDGLKYVTSQPDEVSGKTGDATTVATPAPEVLRAPHAVLVLDVSGSMKKSDPDFLQSEAVLQFCRVYAALAKEITGTGEHARLAVILFSSIPQIVDWHGTEDPWLILDQSALPSLGQVVKAYLGPHGDDPRDGYDTDHLWALQEVERLIDGLETPPAIVFMTDGVCELAPLLSPFLSQAERERQFPDSYAQNLETVCAVSDGEHRWLDVSSEAPIFLTSDLTQEAQGLAYDSEVQTRIPTAIREAKERILSKGYWLSREREDQPPLWAAVFLGALEREADWNEIRDLLSGAGVANAWGISSSFVQCEAAHELVGEFIEILAHWFNLDAKPIPPNSKGIQVPLLTQAFAVHVRTGNDASHFTLDCEGQSTSLKGAGREWAGVIGGGGQFDFDTGDVGVESGTIYLRPRFEWAMKVPEWAIVSAEGCSLSVGLNLLSLQEGGSVAASTVYPDLPLSVPLTLRIAGAQYGPARQLRRTEDPQHDSAYFGELWLPDLRIGELDVTVDLRGMEAHGVEVRHEQLSRTIELRPNVRFELRDSRGRPSSIHVEGIPREAARLKRFLEEVKGAVRD